MKPLNTNCMQELNLIINFLSFKGLLSNVIIYLVCHAFIIGYVCFYLAKKYGLVYMPQGNG